MSLSVVLAWTGGLPLWRPPWNPKIDRNYLLTKISTPIDLDLTSALAMAAGHNPRIAFAAARYREAYARLERDRVRGTSAQLVLTDLVSLVRRAMQLDDELVPYPDRVRQRYDQWLADQAAAGHTITHQ